MRRRLTVIACRCGGRRRRKAASITGTQHVHRLGEAARNEDRLRIEKGDRPGQRRGEALSRLLKQCQRRPVAGTSGGNQRRAVGKVDGGGQHVESAARRRALKPAVQRIALVRLVGAGQAEGTGGAMRASAGCSRSQELRSRSPCRSPAGRRRSCPMAAPAFASASNEAARRCRGRRSDAGKTLLRSSPSRKGRLGTQWQIVPVARPGTAKPSARASPASCDSRRIRSTKPTRLVGAGSSASVANAATSPMKQAARSFVPPRSMASTAFTSPSGCCES